MFISVTEGLKYRHLRSGQTASRTSAQHRQNRIAKRDCEQRGYGVADLREGFLHVSHESEAVREGLEPGCFTNGDSPSLSGLVVDVRIGVILEMGRNGMRRTITT